MLREVLGRGAAVSAIGLAAGLAGALALSRFLESVLYEVGTRDAGTFMAVAVVIGAASVAGTYLPARRASAVDPTAALKYE